MVLCRLQGAQGRRTDARIGRYLTLPLPLPFVVCESKHMLRQHVKVTGSTIDSNNTTVMHHSHTTNSGLCCIPSGGCLPLMLTINVYLYQTTADELLGRTPVLYACHYYSVETSFI